MVELGAWHIIGAVTAVVVVWSFMTYLLCLPILIIALTIVIVATYSILRKPRAEDLMTGMRWPDDKGALRRNNIRMAVILVVAVLVTAGTLALVKDYIYDSESWIEHSYSVSIDALTTDAYWVMCPVPCDSDGAIYEGFLDELEVVDGTAVLTLLDTEHGRALVIQGQGDLELEWNASYTSGSIDGEKLQTMTMTENLDWDTATSWVYSDSGGISIEIHRTSSWREMVSGGIPSGGLAGYVLTTEPEGAGWETVVAERGLYAIS